MSSVEALRSTTNKPAQDQWSALLLQRKRACGGSRGLIGSCSDGESTKLLAKPMRAKLRVNDPGDEYEQEADRVAERVMQTADAKSTDAGPRLFGKPMAERRILPEAAGFNEAPPIVEKVMSSAGQPLDAGARAFFEPRFGCDFSRVRVHADSEAVASARAVGALAYTVGSDVVFGPGQYAPESRAGYRLLAHELTHVVQQRAAAGATLESGPRSRPRAGMTTETRMGPGQPVHAARGAIIQRQPEPEPPTFPNFPGLFEALEKDVGKNLRDYGHHLYQASLLHPDEPRFLENALSRYALGLNVLKTSYRFAGLGQGAADKLALGTGILFKGLNFVREGEFVFDFQIDIGKGLKLEANLDLAVNPDKLTEVRKSQLGLGLVGEF